MPASCERAGSNPYASRNLDLDSVFSHLVDAALEGGSKQSYSCAWSKYNEFCSSDNCTAEFPIKVHKLMRFILYLYCKGYDASTIRSTVSAHAYKHNLYDVPDPSKAMLVKKALIGLDKLRPPKLTRKPISREMLHCMVDKAPEAIADYYNCMLFQAMVVLGFYFLLRVGEMTNYKEGQSHGLHLSDIHFGESDLSITFRSYKHNKGNLS